MDRRERDVFALVARSFLGPQQLDRLHEIERAAKALVERIAPDRRLVLGSLTFGIGWGLAGLCPGPALVSMAAGQGKALLFVLAMLAGMRLFDFFERRIKET